MSELPERLPTKARAAIRLVVRGVPLPDGGNFNVGDLRVLIISRAKPSEWPDAELQRGDLEGVVWVAPVETFRAAATLQASERVVAVRGDIGATP